MIALRTYASNALRRFDNFINQSLHFPKPVPCLAGMEHTDRLTDMENKTENSFSELLNGIWLMAAPKSKVTHARKSRKHLRYIPKPKVWQLCNKCGEPKLPHRICKINMDVCAMREDEWAAYKAKKEAEKAATSS